MAEISIPSKFLSGYGLISHLTASQVKAVSEIFGQKILGDKPNIDLSAYDNLKDIPLRDLDQIINTIYSVLHFSIKLKKDTQELAKSLANSYFIQTNTTKDEALLKNLGELLVNTDNLKLSIKAVDIMREKDKIYDTSRILTDVRYIFDDSDVLKDKRLAVIIHNLKIEYQQNDDDHTIFVAMSMDDLLELKANIDRAIEKATQIKEQDFEKGIVFVNI